MLVLGWPFYNPKSSKPNGSASLFERRNRRLLVTLSKLSIQLVQWPELVLAKASVKTPYRLSASLMSPLNQLHELQSITVALALLLSLPLAHTTSVAPHSSRELFTELKELQPINSDFCALTVDIFRALTLIPACASTPPTKKPFKQLLKA